MRNTFFYLSIFSAFIVSCTNKKIVSTEKAPKVEYKVVEEDPLPLSPPIIPYFLFATADSLDWLKSLVFPNDTLDVLLKMNRVDHAHLLRLDTLVLPDTICSNTFLYSPFPIRLAFLGSIKKMIYVSYKAQAIAMYENGDLIRWTAASLGKQLTPTPKGQFHTNWKAKKTVSTIDEEWVLEWYFNIENFQGVSFHEYALPGYPASHACIRMFREDANWLYYWAEQWKLANDFHLDAYGTPVVIFDDYPFGQRKPWLELAENKDALTYSPAQMEDEIKDYLLTLIDRQNVRDSLLIMKLNQNLIP
jgi:hypothetical protein